MLRRNMSFRFFWFERWYRFDIRGVTSLFDGYRSKYLLSNSSTPSPFERRVGTDSVDSCHGMGDPQTSDQRFILLVSTPVLLRTC
jgi:hypothetical protein